MPDTTVSLANEGLTDGDDISPYINEHWNDGVEVRIPPGSYQYDGSGLHGKRGDCALIGSEEGVEFHRPDDDSQVRPTIQCDHGSMRIENITVRGASPPSENTNGSRWRLEATAADSVIEVVNVNHPDGSENNSDSNAFLTYDEHRGTLHFKNCYVANFGNSSFYTNLGYRSDERNPVIIENCTIINPNGAIRAGHNGSQYKDCTIVWRDPPSTWVNGSSLARGFRFDDPHGGEDILVENCHFYFGSDIGSAAGAMEFESGPFGGTVRDIYIETHGDYGGLRDKGGMGGFTFENINLSGPGSPVMHNAPTHGSEAPDLRNEDVVWMPESRTVRPGGRSGDLFTIMSETPGEDLLYNFVVDGSVQRATDPGFNGASSEGEANVTISTRSDGTVAVDGKTGNEFGDAFRVFGEVLEFSKTGASDYQLYLNGDPVEFPANGDSGDDTTDDGSGDTSGDGLTEADVLALIEENTLSEAEIRDYVDARVDMRVGEVSVTDEEVRAIVEDVLAITEEEKAVIDDLIAVLESYKSS